MEYNINKSEYKILIVDDIASNVLLLKVLLSNEKFQVTTATNGQEAIDKAHSEMPDLILLDVMMPGMNGFEVARHLKADDETKDIPIVFLTALNSMSDVVEGFKAGGNDYVFKPFNKDELLIRVMHQISLVASRRIIIRQTEELQHTIMGRDKMYSVIAHDLRSPMGSIKMILNMLAMSISKESIGEEMYEMLNMANESAEETFALLDNLLKWTKSQTGRLKVVYQDFELVGTIEGVLEIFMTLAAVKGIELKMDSSVEMKMIDVHGDIDMVKTIMRNFLSNAIKFSEQNGDVVISIKEVDDMAVIGVRDFGCGISKEAQEKLLKADTHFSTFGTNKEEGSGLGLLLCQDFAVKNGGKLWFESVKGEGSTFYFSIPLKR